MSRRRRPRRPRKAKIKSTATELSQGTPVFPITPKVLDSTLIKHAVAKYFTEKCQAVHFELGLNPGGSLRADVCAATIGGRITIIEVKSSVADYRSDKKWQGYQLYCDQLYLAMSIHTYEKLKAELPKGIGVFVVKDNGIACLRGRSPKVPIADPELRLAVMSRMAYRSANVMRNNVKAKTSGAYLVADTAIAAIRAVPKDQRTGQTVREAIVKAISLYV